MRAVSDGLAACLLDRSDGNKTMLRAVSRELLAAAVLRNVMFYFTPYTVNKACIFHLILRRPASSQIGVHHAMYIEGLNSISSLSGFGVRCAFDSAKCASLSDFGSGFALESAPKRCFISRRCCWGRCRSGHS